MNRHARHSPEEVGRQVASAREETVRANLALLDSEGVKRKDPRRLHALAQLAETLAERGQFGEAAKLAPTKELRAEYRSLNAAVWRDDSKGCRCPETKKVDAEGTEVPNAFVERMVISEKHGGRLMPLVRCLCGDANVRPMPAALAAIEDEQAKAHAEAREKLR